MTETACARRYQCAISRGRANPEEEAGNSPRKRKGNAIENSVLTIYKKSQVQAKTTSIAVSSVFASQLRRERFRSAASQHCERSPRTKVCLHDCKLTSPPTTITPPRSSLEGELFLIFNFKTKQRRGGGLAEEWPARGSQVFATRARAAAAQRRLPDYVYPLPMVRLNAIIIKKFSNPTNCGAAMLWRYVQMADRMREGGSSPIVTLDFVTFRYYRQAGTLYSRLLETTEHWAMRTQGW